MKAKIENSKLEKNIHEGHRERLLNLALNAGVDNMSDVQVVEFFLTYIFPRGDVNPLAHRLLDTYGTFSHIVDSSEIDLISVKGLNERSAKRIKMFSELFYVYSTAKMSKKTVVETKKDLIDVVEDLLRFRTTENMALIGLSPANIITCRKRIVSSETDEVKLTTLQLTSFLASNKPTSFAVAHCHPFGSCLPSPSDAEAYKMISNICFNCGVRFLGSFILGEDGVYSQQEEQIVRSYCDVKELKNKLKTLN